MTGRIVIDDISPSTPNGFAPSVLVGEALGVGATIFRDGHGLLAAQVRWRREGSDRWGVLPLVPGYEDRWTATLSFEEIGRYEVVIDAWTRRFATWRRDLQRWLSVGEDVASELLAGADLLSELSERVPSADRARLEAAIKTMRTTTCADRVRLDAGLDDAVVALVDRVADPWDATSSATVVVEVERRRAGVGAWYEMFPRTEGGLRGSIDRLDAIAEMGFDVVYLPPIHPIGVTGRKGRGNSPTALPGEVGSPWAIGSPAGGHCSIEPTLGTLADFDAFVEAAAERGLEVALDYALQCSPDHPWVQEHPAWFRRRGDGSIRYAENPPKRYQDIYPLDFWTAEEADRIDLWTACHQILEFWIDRGVRIFRVDNPHTKPMVFWEWLIPLVRSRHPDVVFLSEAFTKPAMMHRLAEVGFSQSYTYFTWRHEPWDVRAYVEELAYGPARGYFRPTFWPTTPDILAGVLRNGNRAAFQLRALLAALLSPSYGIYSGYELCENRPASPDNEEFADSEKYQLVERDWLRPDSLAPFLASLNTIRRAHSACESLDVVFHHSENDRMLAWSKGDLVVIANFDVSGPQESTVWIDAASMGLPERFEVVDLLDDDVTYRWQGGGNYVRLDPSHAVAHVFRIEPDRPGTPA